MKHSKKGSSPKFRIKTKEEKKLYSSLLKAPGDIFDDRTYKEDDTEGTNSTGKIPYDESVKKQPIIKTSKWLVIKDQIRDNILVYSGILGFIVVIAGAAIWFNNLRRDVDTVQKNVETLQSQYNLLDSEKIKDENKVDLLKLEIRQQIESLANRTADLERKISPKLFR